MNRAVFHSSSSRSAMSARRSASDVSVAMPHRDVPFGKPGDAQRVAEDVRQLLKLENLFRVGLFVHAVQGTDAAAFEVSRDRLIGGQHELLDQAMRDIALAADDARH